ncbi:MAG: prepilin-type N-terminal cleavage/methylation domain-containing protein [Phycisphaerae bacterium]|jgi:prepilin-type N-terminal cleavage/methylation domain-containing protein/prepilin-type processing-associated H-X9-DG protein
MFKKKAFTLIELLVVIAIIAMLMAILMPALQAGKEQGARAACLSDLKQVTLAWVMYADNNDDKIPGSDIGYVAIGQAPRSAWWIDWPSGVSTPPAVYGVFSYVDLTRPTGGYTVVELIEHAEQALKNGRLWPYINDLKVFKCPNSRKGDYQSYAMVDSLNGWCGWADAATTVKMRVTTRLQIKRPSERMVLVCECPEGFGGGKGSWGIYYTSPQFGDAPPKRHGNGGTFSFADGHAEYWKWKNKSTIDGPDDGNWLGWDPGVPHDDLKKLQRAIWGGLGYPEID